MTIATDTSRIQYAGNGVATAFPVPFPFLDEADLQVILTSSSGVDTVQTLTTHYTLAGGSPTGTVTMVTAPANGETLTILRDMDVVQPIAYPVQGGYQAQVLEESLDRLTMLVQQMRELLGRSLTLPASSDVSDLVLPEPSDGKYLGWSGSALANLSLQTTALTVSAFIETLLNDVDAATARATLGENASGSFFTRKHNFGASAAPTAGDDTGDGYVVGSWWFDTTNDNVYVCADASLGAAVWRTMIADRGPAFKNRITNGDVVVDQRNGGATVSVNGTSNFFGPDMWRGSGAAADGVFTIQRSTSTPPTGFTHFLRATVTTADASIGATQAYALHTPIEGLNAFDLGFGAAGAQSVTLSFRVRSSLTGTFSGALTNGARNRTYPFSFTINAANTWETKTITIAGDTSGTWPTDNTQWGAVYFDLGAGTSVRAAANAWTATANAVGVTSATSLIATLGATFDVTGVQLEAGSGATEFERLFAGEREARCARYHQIVTGRGFANAGGGGSNNYQPLSWPVTMRATPSSVDISETLDGNTTSAVMVAQDNTAGFLSWINTAAGYSGARVTARLTAEL